MNGHFFFSARFLICISSEVGLRVLFLTASHGGESFKDLFVFLAETRLPSGVLTMTDAAALEPRARGIPHKLLLVLLDGYVEGVADIWVVEVSHT